VLKLALTRVPSVEYSAMRPLFGVAMTRCPLPSVAIPRHRSNTLLIKDVLIGVPEVEYSAT
jgi:hypothetical protein